MQDCEEHKGSASKAVTDVIVAVCIRMFGRYKDSTNVFLWKDLYIESLVLQFEEVKDYFLNGFNNILLLITTECLVHYHYKSKKTKKKYTPPHEIYNASSLFSHNQS